MKVRVAFLEVDGEPRSVAEFRVMEKLWTGRILHVDDLVTDEAARSRGYGARPVARHYDWATEPS